MENKLPEGWEWKKLGDLTEKFVSGGTPPTKNESYWNGTIPWTTSARIASRFIDSSEKYITEDAVKSSATNIVPKNNVLIATRVGIGKSAVNLIDLAISQDLTGVILNKSLILPAFLVVYLHSPKLKQNLELSARGSTIRGLTRSDVENIKVPLPPLETQQKMVAILEKAEETKKLRAQADELTQKLLQSVFLEMFGDPVENPNNWSVSEFKNINKEFRYGSSTKSSDIGYPILRIPNVVDGEINLKDLKYCELLDKEYEKLRLLKGDILFVRTNGNQDYVGRCAIIEEQQENFVYASYLIRARIDSKIILPQYLKAFFSTTHGKSLIKGKTKTSAGQFNVNTEGLGLLPILVPPMKLQQKFIEIVNKIEKTKKSQNQSSLEINTLFDALMQKAFTGELVS